MALIDLLKIINHQVTTVKGRTPITGYELNRILNEIAVFADSGGGVGNGIYGGSGSLSGATLVTMGANDLTFAGNQRIILDGTTLLQLGSLAGNVIRNASGNLKIEALAGAGNDLTLDASQGILINGILSASIIGASNSFVINTLANTFTDTTNSKGIVYGADYSANFTVRSLVDKDYVDNAVSGGGGDLAATLTLGEDANAGQDVILHYTGKFILDDDQVAPVSSNLELSINASQALIETTGVAGASRILTLKSNQPGSGIHLETGAIRIGSVANHNISIAGVTGSRTAILQDSDGTIAYLSDITGGSGDMLAATYDPTGIGADAFDKANEIGIEQVTGTIITPPTLTGNVNDYNPTGFATSNMIRQDIDANNREITGFVAPSAGVDRIIYICNINAGTDDIKFTDNDAGSVAANRILLRDSGDKALKSNETAAFWYDHTSLRWRPYNRIG